jgi:predicted metal-binding membrane protein
MNTLALEARPRPAVLVSCVLVFLASTWVTIAWCGSLCDMPGMGVWSRMPGQTWLEHFLVFEGMWMVMMIAMMMPVFAPVLLREIAAPLPVAMGYFMAWSLLGVALYPLGVAAAALAPGPMVGGVLVIVAGVLQFGERKARLLKCCMTVPGTAFRDGLRTGIHCIRCCAGLTATLLVVGVMDLRAMALATLAIAAERLLPSSTRAAPAIGVGLIGIGVVLCARALGW